MQRGAGQRQAPRPGIAGGGQRHSGGAFSVRSQAGRSAAVGLPLPEGMDAGPALHP